MPIVRRSDCLLLSMISCPVVVVMMLESRVVRCVHCDEDVAKHYLINVTIFERKQSFGHEICVLIFSTNFV
jgi:hypothetical protein